MLANFLLKSKFVTQIIIFQVKLREISEVSNREKSHNRNRMTTIVRVMKADSKSKKLRVVNQRRQMYAIQLGWHVTKFKKSRMRSCKHVYWSSCSRCSVVETLLRWQHPSHFKQWLALIDSGSNWLYLTRKNSTSNRHGHLYRRVQIWRQKRPLAILLLLSEHITLREIQTWTQTPIIPKSF